MSAPANPNLSVVRASSNVFEAVDSTDDRFFIKGILASGLLQFTVVARLRGGQAGAVSGQEFFDAMMANFQPRVMKIEGHLVSGIDLDTNIRQFNHWTGSSRGNLSDQDAAKSTWTGRRAADYHFHKVRVLLKDPPNAQGSYIEVIAHFTR